MHKTKGTYHYTESGLDNVYIKGATIYKCACGEELTEIPNVVNLHRIISFEIIKSFVPMTGPEIRFIRKQMKMKAVDLAGYIGVDEVTISRWENDIKPIGTNNDRLIRLLFIKNIEEELKMLVGMSFLKTILTSLPHKTIKVRKAFEVPIFNIPVNSILTGFNPYIRMTPDELVEEVNLLEKLQ